MKSLKKALILVLSLILVISAFPFAASASDAEQTTQITTDGWTSISTKEQFLAMESTGNYYLTNDIDFGGYDARYLLAEFNGVLDGNDYVIYNFSLTSDTTNEASSGDTLSGMFGQTTNATVRNLKIGGEVDGTTHYIQATVDGVSKPIFGFVTGKTNGGSTYIQNVDIYGNLTTTNIPASKEIKVGGVIGVAYSATLDNVIVNGFIKENSTTDIQANIGGFIGQVLGGSSDTYGRVVLKNCVNKASISNPDQSSSKAERVAGMIAFVNDSVLISNCRNEGTVTTNAKYVASFIAVTYGDANDAIIIKDCINKDANTKIISYLHNNAKPYFYVYGFTSSNPNDSHASYDNATLVSDVSQITSTGIYRLSKDIVLNDAEAQYLLNFDFCGILDGNGHSISGFSLTDKNESSGGAGLFKSISNNSTTGIHDSAILDLTIGTAAAPLSITATKGNNVGALAGTVGQSNYGAIISGVTTYVNIDYTGTSSKAIGGIAGGNNRVVYENCRVYGNITANTDTTSYVNAGGLCGAVSTDGCVFTDCVNLANISVTTGAGEKRAAGFIGYMGYGYTTFANCYNFGKISAYGDAGSGKNYTAGGFIAHANVANKRVQFLDCANFGDITAENGSASGVIGAGKCPLVVDGCTIFGTAANIYGSESASGYSLSNYNSGTDSVLTMVKGASVRLSDPTGIRFTAISNVKALEIIRALADNDIVTETAMVSFGTLIAPMSFVTGNFEKGEENYTAPAGVIPYVDVESNGFFKNVDGQIAGSLVGIDSNMKDVKFVGRAYISFVAGGKTITFYAKMNDNERSVVDVATAALNDLLYKKDGVFYVIDGEDYVENTAKDVSKYSATGDTADGYEVYSRYTADEMIILNNLKDSKTANAQ